LAKGILRCQPDDPGTQLRAIRPLRIILTTILLEKSNIFGYLLVLSNTLTSTYLSKPGWNN
jgi:hypothetical protein